MAGLTTGFKIRRDGAWKPHFIVPFLFLTSKASFRSLSSWGLLLFGPFATGNIATSLSLL